MRSRRWFDWHSWIGTTAGLLLFVICWSGTVAVFSEEIDWLLNPAERVEPTGEMRSWGEWQRAAQRAYPDLRADSIIAPRTPHSAAEVWLETPDGKTLRTYVNPYTAEVTGQTSYFNVQRFFRSLHMSMFDPGGRGFGYYFVMSFSVVVAASVVTSLMFYKRWWRRFFVLHIHSTARAFWSDLHKLAGLWSLWFLLLMAVTGLWYLIEFAGVGLGYPEISPIHRDSRPQALPTDQLLEQALSADRLLEQAPSTDRLLEQAPSTDRLLEQALSANRLLEQAQKAAPRVQFEQMYLPGGYFGDVSLLHGQGDAVLVRNRANAVMLDAASGAPMLVRTASDLRWPARWVDTADPLHFGNFAGLLSKTVWFIFGLLMSGLMLTGAYLHVRRQQRHHPPVPRRWPVLAAYATTLAVLGVASAGAVREYSQYASIPPPPAVWLFIALWTATTVAVLTVWMKHLR